MPRRPKHLDPQSAYIRVRALLDGFEQKLKDSDLRSQVLELVPVVHGVRDLGISLCTGASSESARDRILAYLLKYPEIVITGDELLVVSGIGEWARRVRELRVQLGWRILTGVTIRTMMDDPEPDVIDPTLRKMKPDDYVLVSTEQDTELAYRWHLANTIRRGKQSVREKILEFLRSNVGKKVTGEELVYLASGQKEWARRIRELRTEFGWPVSTKVSGRPDLPVGVYVLEEDRQLPPHDRNIPEAIRRQVLVRDGYKCQSCGWNHDSWNTSDPRHLEVHHRIGHAEGGANTEENLLTLCKVCHDEVHAGRKYLD